MGDWEEWEEWEDEYAHDYDDRLLPYEAAVCGEWFTLDALGKPTMSTNDVVKFVRHLDRLEEQQEADRLLAVELEEEQRREFAKKRKRQEEEDRVLARELSEQHQRERADSLLAEQIAIGDEDSELRRKKRLREEDDAVLAQALQEREDAAKGGTNPRPLLPSEEINGLCLDRCAEKIDAPRLRALVANLERDRDLRRRRLATMLQEVTRNPATKDRYAVPIALLRRVEQLEKVAEAYRDVVDEDGGAVPDEMGFVKFEVLYRHKDRPGEGRLFAAGVLVSVAGLRARSATLQGMPAALRNTLTGAFLHDIDCVNSEVRNVCSLAAHLGLTPLVRALLDYRDNRSAWLERIGELHNCSRDDAKRVVTIIMSGGSYETWLRTYAREPVPLVEAFAHEISAEVAALCAALPAHFPWTVEERRFLEMENQAKNRRRNVEQQLFNRIVQSAENTVLSHLHASFHEQGWVVRAKVFDGLMVEPGGGGGREGGGDRRGLEDTMRQAELCCLLHGWDVQLVEKELFGLPDSPIEVLDMVRQMIG